MRKLNHEVISKFITVDHFNNLVKEVTDKIWREKQQELIDCKYCLAFGPPIMRYFSKNFRLAHSSVDGAGLSTLEKCPNEELYTNAIWEKLDQIIPENKLEAIGVRA